MQIKYLYTGALQFFPFFFFLNIQRFSNQYLLYTKKFKKKNKQPKAP